MFGRVLSTTLGAIYTTRNDFVGNKAKGRISKQVLQENKARQVFFRKTNISYPLFSKLWRALFSCNTRFEIRIFALFQRFLKWEISTKMPLK